MASDQGDPTPRDRSTALGLLALIGLCVAVVAVAVRQPYQAPGQTPNQPTAASPGAASKETVQPPLEVEGWHWTVDTDTNFATVEGEVKNISGAPIRDLEAVATFKTKGGDLITSSDALVDFDPVMPGQTSPFKVYATYNPEMNQAYLAFQRLDGAEVGYLSRPPRRRAARR